MALCAGNQKVSEKLLKQIDLVEAAIPWHLSSYHANLLLNTYSIFHTNKWLYHLETASSVTKTLL